MAAQTDVVEGSPDEWRRDFGSHGGEEEASVEATTMSYIAEFG
jgi:hypothetical protein